METTNKNNDDKNIVTFTPLPLGSKRNKAYTKIAPDMIEAIMYLYENECFFID